MHANRILLTAPLLLAACAGSNPRPPPDPADWATPATQPGPEAAPTQANPAPVGPAAPADANAAKRAEPEPVVPDAIPTSAAPSTAEPIVANVAGRPVYVSELLTQWLYADSITVLEHLDNLALSRIVVAEATRLGVRVAPEVAEEAYERGARAIEREIQSKPKHQGVTLDQYVREVLGLDSLRYRERLRDDALRTLLGERVVRCWLLQNEHAFLRVIVVQSEADSELVRQDLAAGKAFEDVARERSKDPSKKDGGRIAPIVKSDTPIARLAFSTEPGTVGGPVTEGGNWLYLSVTRRGQPMEGDWTALGAAVEASLAEQRVDPLELSQWKRAILDRYQVDLKPFLRLAGER